MLKIEEKYNFIISIKIIILLSFLFYLIKEKKRKLIK
jgi:hypothetical protein